MTTTLANVISVAAAGITGILIARALGPSPRGEYASVVAWFGIVLAVGTLGQTTATTYFVANDPAKAKEYVATSRNMMITSGVVATTIGILAEPWLSKGNENLQFGYRLLFLTCLASFLGASLTFSLQAVSTLTWNLIRIFQPCVYASGVWLFYLTGHLSFDACISTTSATVALQTVLAYFACRRNGLTGGRPSMTVARQMGKYGVQQLISTVPTILLTRLDLLVLSVSADAESVGNYAVASSLTALATPLVSALGSVVFPQIAAAHKNDIHNSVRMHRRAIAMAAALSAVVCVSILTSADWLVTGLFGMQYRGSVILVLILAPGAAMLACAQICADILRGYGKPLTVAKVQWWSAIATVLVMLVLIPQVGAIGAATAISMSAFISLTFLSIAVERTGARLRSTTLRAY